MDAELAELAAAHRVATSYRGEGRRLVEVADDVVVRVLGLLDVDATTPLTEGLAQTLDWYSRNREAPVAA